MADVPVPPDPNNPPGGDAGRGPKGRGKDDDTLSMHRLAGIGVEFIAAFGIFAALGWYADRKLGTGPWLLIAGAAIGFVGGLRNMIKAGRQAMK